MRARNIPATSTQMTEVLINYDINRNRARDCTVKQCMLGFVFYVDGRTRKGKVSTNPQSPICPQNYRNEVYQTFLYSNIKYINVRLYYFILQKIYYGDNFGARFGFGASTKIPIYRTL